MREVIAAHAETLAAVIMEPMQRAITPVPGFLEAVREATTEHGVLLIFDEVVTGFRLAYGGAQEYFGVVPDLATYAKAIGGGYPLAAVAGRRDLIGHRPTAARQGAVRRPRRHIERQPRRAGRRAGDARRTEEAGRP